MLKNIAVIIILFTIFIVRIGFCGDNSGKSAADFLNLDISARMESLGGSGIADNEAIENVFINPGTLGDMKGSEFLFCYRKYFLDIKQGTIGYYKENKIFKCGIALSYLNSGSIERTTMLSPDGGIGKFKTQHLLVNLSSATEIYKDIKCGVNIKYIKEKLDSYESRSEAVDLGILFTNLINKKVFKIDYGMSMLNFGKGQKFVKASEKLPLKFKYGIKVRIEDLDLSIVCDYTLDIIGEDAISVGMEYYFKKKIYIRTGYNSLKDIGTKLFYGIGLKFENVAIDLSFKENHEFNSTAFLTAKLFL